MKADFKELRKEKKPTKHTGQNLCFSACPA